NRFSSVGCRREYTETIVPSLLKAILFILSLVTEHPAEGETSPSANNLSPFLENLAYLTRKPAPSLPSAFSDQTRTGNPLWSETKYGPSTSAPDAEMRTGSAIRRSLSTESSVQEIPEARIRP